MELSDHYGTPLCVYDEELIRRKCREFKNAFEQRHERVEIAYAAKAFLSAEMARLIDQEGLGLDVASEGELQTALLAGVPPEKLTLHGAFKTNRELESAIKAKVGLIVADSIYEIAQLDTVTGWLGVHQKVAIRLNPATDTDTNVKYSTGNALSKFGISIADGTAGLAIKYCLDAPLLELEGIHLHLGSQLMDASPYREAMRQVATFFAGSAIGWKPSKVILGGGFAARYNPADNPPAPSEWAEALIGSFDEYLAGYCESDVIVGIEPGRSIVAEAGTTLYRVGPVKKVGSDTSSPQYIAVVDGGMSDNPRPIMYSAIHTVVVASSAASTPEWKIRICGRHCENDMLIDCVELPEVKEGDILAVLGTGAYTHSMSSNYNRFPRPAVIFVKEGSSREILRRETLEDLIATDLALNPAR